MVHGVSLKRPEVLGCSSTLIIGLASRPAEEEHGRMRNMAACSPMVTCIACTGAISPFTTACPVVATSCPLGHAAEPRQVWLCFLWLLTLAFPCPVQQLVNQQQRAGLHIRSLRLPAPHAKTASASAPALAHFSQQPCGTPHLAAAAWQQRHGARRQAPRSPTCDVCLLSQPLLCAPPQSSFGPPFHARTRPLP